MDINEISGKSILDMCGGAFKEKVDLGCSEVIRNLLDPNTPAKTKRKVTLEFTFSTNEDRQNIVLDGNVKLTLAPLNPSRTFLYASNDEDIFELRSQVPGQTSISGEEEEPPSKLRLLKFG